MALVNRSFLLDITPGTIPQVVKVSEYDENREYTVTLIDEGGAFEIPSGTTATVEGSIGGNAFSESATISGNTITFTLTESMTAKAGDVWCKIKLVKDSKPIQTCAFILRVDKAGVEAGTIIGASGFEEQINQGVADWLDGHEPFFTLPEGGEDGETLVSDGQGGAYWSQPRGSGMTDEFVTAFSAFLDHLSGVFDDQNGQTYIDNLKNAMQGSSGSDTIFANGVLTILQSATSISASQSGSVLTLS